MGTLVLPENLCAHRKGAIEELIKGRARDTAAQPQILFRKPTGDHDWLEEPLVELLTSFTGSLSHVLMSSCEDCEVSLIPNQVRSPFGDQRSVDPLESSKRPAATDLCGCCKRRCTNKHDQGCQATKQVQRIQEAPHMYPTNYFGRHHTCTSYSLNDPSQNPLLEAHLLSFSSKTISTQDSETYSPGFSSKTITTQDSEPHSLSFSSKTISTQYSSCPSSASSVRKECGEETVQSNSLSGDLPFLPSQDEFSALDLIRQHLLADFSFTQTFISPLEFSSSSILPETHFPNTSKLSERRPSINISTPAEGGLEVSPFTPSSWAAVWDCGDVKGIFDVPPLSPYPTLGYPQLVVI